MASKSDEWLVIGRLFVKQTHQLVTVSSCGDRCRIDRQPADRCPEGVGLNGVPVETAEYASTLAGYDHWLERLGARRPSKNGFRIIYDCGVVRTLDG